MRTKYLAIFFVILCTIFTSSGQLLLKLGLNRVDMTNIFSLIFNLYIIFGLISYALGMLLLLKALKMGELSVLYPFVALSFIWVALASIFILKEAISFINWAGIFLIILGVSFIGMGSEK